jgi:hypothetical protein
MTNGHYCMSSRLRVTRPPRVGFPIVWGLLGGRMWPLVLGGIVGCSTASSGPPSGVEGADGGGRCDGCPVVLASFGCCGGDIAVDETTVYWTVVGRCQPDGGNCTGTVSKMPLDGGAVLALAPEQNNPAGLAVDATHVYWANSGSPCTDGAGPCSGAILSVPLGGGAITTLASQLDAPGRVAVDTTSIYWTNQGRGCPIDAGPSCAGSIMTMPLQGGTPMTLASALNYPSDIAVAGENVYWTDLENGTVMKVPRLGGVTTMLASGQNGPMGITTDATNVYWTGGDGVRMVPSIGGSITTLATGVAQGIAVDPSGIYWTMPIDGTVQKKALDDSAVVTLSEGQDFTGIALTATNVYSISFLPGHVLTMAK